MSDAVAFRLVRPLQQLGYASVLPSVAAGKYHNVGDRVLYAWSSSEMAFLSLTDLVGSSQPSELLRECLSLPADPGKVLTLHQCIATGLMQPADLMPSRNLSQLVRRAGLLGVWVDSELMPSESLLLLNPDDPAFASIRVTSARRVAPRVVDPDFPLRS